MKVTGGCGRLRAVAGGLRERMIMPRAAYIVVGAGHDPRGSLPNDVTAGRNGPLTVTDTARA